MKELQIKVLIVDDEPLARVRIRTLLAEFADVEIIGECANGIEALTAIENLKPDLMFLDIEMPEMDGLSLINNQGNKFLPLIIFVTAYDKYGLSAFNAHAVDYLLKPFDRKRFETALKRARERISSDRIKPSGLSEIVRRIDGRSDCRKHISIRQDGRIFLVKAEKIGWITAERNYVRLHVSGQQSYLRREAIGSIEAQMDSALFRRVHRSAIVNINFIKELRTAASGDYKIILLDGEELVLSRTYQKNLWEFLE